MNSLIINDEMVESVDRNGGRPLAKDQADQSRRPQPQEHVHSKPQIFVTFFRKDRTPVNWGAKQTLEKSVCQTPKIRVEVDQNDGQQNPRAEGSNTRLQTLTDSSDVISRSTFNSTISAFMLSEEQQAIVTDFATTLSGIGGIKAFDSNSKGLGDQEVDISPSSSPFAYNHEVFQTYYTCHIPDEPTPFSPHQYNLKALRIHPSIQTFEFTHKLEVIFDIFTPPPSPTLPSSITVPTRPIKLALFDMDSTLILEEVIDELARSINAYDAVSGITARAMADPSFDFAASLRARVALLKGVPADIWSSLRQKVHIAPGAKELIAGLKARGCVTGVISGGFTPMAEWLKGELGLDLAFANHLAVSAPTAEFAYEHLTGGLDLNDGKVIVTPEFKKATLIAEAGRRGIPMQMTLAAGDGSNDLKMLGAAGLGVAWNAKAKTQEQAPMRLNGGSLRELLYLLGPEEV